MNLETSVEIPNMNGTFNVLCYDGYAVATNEEKEVVILSYPKKGQLTGEELLSIAEYRGLPSMAELDYGDIMMSKGTIYRILFV